MDWEKMHQQKISHHPDMTEGKVFHTATILLYNANKTYPYPPIDSSNRTLLDNQEENNWWALSALILAVGTAAGNILVCLAICWERRLQNVTNYFLMSLAITDLMVAILVMPLGILTLIRGESVDLISMIISSSNYFNKKRS
ncbi:hypothetical protein WA026_000663 [Henosepilachna vigintioctopunctata]|uniref:G-protein coupled receptors family 1 profile domain-containing protein n=1 Tax=Henosepilachna vigintioctopunctata TaxID=420089 RepID=A0AAW1V5N5_9CUCU